MTDFYQTPRFQLPDNWSVTDTICVKVTIPNDPQYYGQLIGLLDTLKWSKNFANDATKVGAATVSRTWQSALESAPLEIEGCKMPELRINPATCRLEVNCTDDPDNPDWKAIITQVTDPRELEYPTPYPDPPPMGQTNECLAAANVGDFVWYASGELAERLGTGAIITEIVVAMAGIIATFFQLLTSAIVDETLILFVNITPASVDDDFALLDKQDFIDLLVCYLNDDGTMPTASWGDFLDDLLALGASNQAWYLVYYVCILMGVGGVTLAAKLGGITEAECAECPCILAVFDFEMSNGGFAGCDIFGTAPIYPVWTSGEGWITQDNGTSYRGAIEKAQTFLGVTKIAVEIYYASGSPHYLAIRETCEGTLIADWSDVGTGLTVKEYTMAAPTDMDGISLYSGSNTSPAATIKRITLYC